MSRLTKDCALFFIGLWNFCDDEGKCRADPRELSHCLPIFRATDIVKHLKRLSTEGLIRFSVGADWLQVVNWSHQKIDKPRQPEIKAKDIQWIQLDEECRSSKALREFVEESTTPRRKDRIGEDRKGKDRICMELGEVVGESSANITPPPSGGGDVPKVASSGSRKKSEPITAKAWAAYSKAFEERYNTPPLRNLTVNSQLASFVRRVGEDLAPEVIAFYVRHRGAFYSQKMHPVGLALADAEKLAAEYRSGRMLTRAAANREESIAANADLAAQIMREE